MVYVFIWQYGAWWVLQAGLGVKQNLQRRIVKYGEIIEQLNIINM